MSVRNYIEVCELDLPSGTVRVAPVSYSSKGRGHFAGQVKAYGPVDIIPSDRSGAMSGLETTVDINDLTGELAQAVEGAYARQIVGSEAARYLAAPEQAFADWRPIFAGIITKDPEMIEPHVFRFTLRVDDGPLETDGNHQGGQVGDDPAPQSTWTINRQTWPNAHPDAIGQVGPRVYGDHSSTNYQTQPGFLPCHYIDTQAWRYSPARGRMKSIDTVFVNDTPTGSGWAKRYLPDRRGQIWTVIEFSTDQGDAVITCDGHGYDEDADGTGALIARPNAILEHALANWHFGRYRNGASWLTPGGQLNNVYGTVHSFLLERHPTAAPYYQEGSGYDLIRDFCAQHGVRMYWGPDGLLQFCVEDVSEDPYGGTEIDWEREVYSFTLTYDDIDVATSLQVEQARSAVSGRFASSFNVTLPVSAGYDAGASRPTPLLWSPAA